MHRATAKFGYVFVVCGAASHLDTLALSYNLLKKKTALPVYVVTDNTRNAYPLVYEHMVDVATPEKFDHHQASIWLKTSLHRLLPKNRTYAYLDTDVLATGKNPDGIFGEFISPVRFAPDHCLMPQFSSYAVNCGCLDTLSEARDKVKTLLVKADPYMASNDAGIQRARKELSADVERGKKRLGLFFYLKYFLSWPSFKTPAGFRLDRRKKLWTDKNGQAVMNHVSMRSVAKQAGLRWKFITNKLTLPDGRNIYRDQCGHLSSLIQKKFGVEITDGNWQHWNGGVFLFNEQSQEFMDTWHAYTMEIFNDPEWKIRDQGTLIATVWKLRLQDHPPLNVKWNLIADYYNSFLEMNDDGKITIDEKIWHEAEFVHVYHHFGDTEWNFWNKTAARL